MEENLNEKRPQQKIEDNLKINGRRYKKEDNINLSFLNGRQPQKSGKNPIKKI